VPTRPLSDSTADPPVVHGRSRPGYRHLLRLAALVALALGLALFGAALLTACSQPVDLNTVAPTAPGGVVDSFLSDNGLSFPAHALVGSVLGACGCDGGAVGLQWLKAGWHATSPADEARVAAGLRRAAELAGDPTRLEAAICPSFPDHLRPSQDRALRAAGLRCPAPVRDE